MAENKTLSCFRWLAMTVGILASACQASREANTNVCRTPAEEDLAPHVEFDDPSLLGDGGNPGGKPGGPGGAADGGVATILDGSLGGGPDGNVQGRIGPPHTGKFPNAFGTGADQVMPGGEVNALDDFADSHPMGTNGRECETCHTNERLWSTTPAVLQERFDTGMPHFSLSPTKYATNETAARNDDLEPIFRTVDGSNSPNADVSTPEARKRAYSMVLSRAVIRIGLPVPDDADFELVSVDDPYHFATKSELSLFRRIPLMSNLRFHTTLMWDGRETAPCATLTTDLRQQASHAITGHAQGSTPPTDAVDGIVQAELRIYAAQYIDNRAGQLDQGGARGGPNFLAQVPFYWGINSFEKTDPNGRPYSREVFNVFFAWRALPPHSEMNEARVQIASGEQLFNSKEFKVSRVSGFNDVLGRAEITATCGACHNAPNVGVNSEGHLMDIGVSGEAHRTTDLPLYTFREKATGATLKTSDPGQALISKNWTDMNRFKVPSLRHLANRPPYFHDGSAASLEAVVDHHDQRFGIGLSLTEKAAFVAFLSAL